MQIIIKIKEKFKNFFNKYERYFSPGALLFGFIIDNLTLRRIDLWAENLLIIIYLFIAGFIIILLNAYEAGRIQWRLFKKVAQFLPIVLQFAFGGLFSVFVVFYSRSASVLASWPFLLFLLVLLIGNELFQKRYQRFAFQLSIYFIALFSYSAFSLPILFGKIGADIFLISGVTSLILICLVVLLLYKISPDRFFEGRKALIISISFLYIFFNVLYFTNIIPPIPLSLQDNGIYHSIKRAGSDYEVKYEKAPWYFFFHKFNHTVHWQKEKPIYCYSAIFAPTKISTNIYHRWQYYNETQKKWIEKSKLSFPIQGGRDNGYRGFSFKYSLAEGKWRVDVINERGQVLGRTKFKIKKVDKPVELIVDKK